MKKKPSKVRVKKVKAWAVMKSGRFEAFEIISNRELDIYTNKISAERRLSNIYLHSANGYRVVPITITYSLPTQPKGKKK